MPKTTNDGRRFYEAANRVLNKLFDTQTPIKMVKVTNKLKLTADASEESILASIESIENRAITAESELAKVANKSKEDLEKMKADMEEMEDKLKAKQKEYEDCKNALDAANKEKEDAENAAKEEKAKNLVEEAAKIGKIKNEAAVIEAWKKDAIADFASAKAKLDGIPMNKAAVKFVVASAASENATKYPSVGVAMAMISNKLEQRGK